MQKPRSIYQRTTLATFASVMVAFTILSLIFFSVMNERVDRLQREQLYTTALTLRNAAEIKAQGRPGEEQFVALSFAEKADLLAESTGAYIWLVRKDGIIIHASAIPEAVEAQCRHLVGGLYQLPMAYVAPSRLTRQGLILQNSEYANLFKEQGKSWISVLLPVREESQWRGAVLQLHLPYVDRYNWRWFLNNGLGMAFLVSVIISIALTLILMNELTLPLEALVTAARQVTLGDYSVRIHYADIDRADARPEVDESDGIRRLMITFNTMVERLEAINEEQRDLIAGISHDMKTPLTSIVGFTDALLDGMVPKASEAKYLGIIKKEASRLKNLLQDLNVDLSLTGPEGSVLETTDFDINEIFREVLEGLEPQIKDKGLLVERQLEGEKKGGLWVTADREQISRVVYNLVSNAVKFCPPGSTIRVGTSHLEGALFMRGSVEDSGPGIPERMRNQVFGRFVKLDKSRGNHEGSGLGLYISRQILAKHGQTIMVKESEALGGARFVFTLPMAKDKAPAAEPKRKARPFARWMRSQETEPTPPKEDGP